MTRAIEVAPSGVALEKNEVRNEPNLEAKGNDIMLRT